MRPYLEDAVMRLDRRGFRYIRNPVEGFRVSLNTRTLGGVVEFSFAHQNGIKSAVLKRNITKDPGSAKILGTWEPKVVGLNKKITYSDDDSAIYGRVVYYWLEVLPLNDALKNLLVGPQTLDPAAADLAPPSALLSFDLSKSTGLNGVATVYGAFDPPNEARWEAVNIYAANYHGNPADVLLKTFTQSPFSFAVDVTNENVTFKGRSVSRASVLQDAGTVLTKALLLAVAPTVPARVCGGTAITVGSDVQVSFDAGAEPDNTRYDIYRAASGGGFGASVFIGSVNPTGSGRYTYTHVGGAGAFEWFVVAVNAQGNSAASLVIVPPS